MTELPRQSNGAPRRLSWNHPMCDSCWRQRNPARRACRLVDAERQVCGWCGLDTRSGIYVRADPETVPFPAERDD